MRSKGALLVHNLSLRLIMLTRQLTNYLINAHAIWDALLLSFEMPGSVFFFVGVAVYSSIFVLLSVIWNIRYTYVWTNPDKLFECQSEVCLVKSSCIWRKKQIIHLRWLVQCKIKEKEKHKYKYEIQDTGWSLRQEDAVDALESVAWDLCRFINTNTNTYQNQRKRVPQIQIWYTKWSRMHRECIGERSTWPRVGSRKAIVSL